MDSKSLATLELPKVLDRLASETGFCASRKLALRLRPTSDLAEAQLRQQETTEARKLLAVRTDVTIGGAQDVRRVSANAARGTVLLPTQLLDIKITLVAARELKRTLTRLGKKFPRLALLAEGLVEIPGTVEAISRTLDERGEVLDSASGHLAAIRRDLRVSHDRLLQKLQSLIDKPRNAECLQEKIITQRADRYVIPIKANFRRRIGGIVHDQSASGGTFFVEPLATVELNNHWRQLQLAEEEEIRRILATLSAKVGELAHQITTTVEALAALDLAFAKAQYAEALNASEPILLDFRPDQAGANRAHPGSTVQLRDARHPLLDPETVVPIDAVLDDQTYVVVITGPNTGGKTVGLKTVGLLVLMAQCGLHIPAKSGSTLSIFAGVYGDIGDDQSIEENLSTFSSHITNIIRILQQVDKRSLVLLDEVGAGTDPSEGAALARALLSYLLEVGATTLVTTHDHQLKVYAHNTPGVINASVDFDPERLAPTYRLTIGLPGRSNALVVASRLGLGESVVTEARRLLGAADQQATDLLEEIQRQRELARQERALAEGVREDLLQLEAELTRRLESIDEERRDVLAKARVQTEAELDQLRTEIKAMRRRLKDSGLPLTALQQIEEQTQELEAGVQEPPPSSPTLTRQTEPGTDRPLRLGDQVWVDRLQVAGVIASLSTSAAEVQIGRMRLRAQRDDLSLVSEPAPQPATRPSPKLGTQTTSPSPGMELHIRGQRIEDGLEALDRYLDAATLAELPWVRIIHGKGSGRLRAAVRHALREHPLVKSYEPGKEGEGGEGLTVVKLALDGL